MKKVALLLLLITLIFSGLFLVTKNKQKNTLPNVYLKKEKPFEKYTIDNLAKTQIEHGNFSVSTPLTDMKNYTSQLFTLRFKPDFTDYKNTTGQLNLPTSNGTFPLVIMLRGYVNQSVYKTGDGTKNASAFFANNGFITVSPDFLGYGGSDPESRNIFETRFQTYVTVLALVKTLDDPSFFEATQNKWDGKNIFIWAHSNGGQIALTVLEILGKNFPTTLWAPVTKPFPYSVLYYTDEADDGGKLIRRELAKFEDNYDTDQYSLTKFLDRINTTIQISQGTSDDAVPVTWSLNFIKMVKALKKDVKYNEFPGNDHNMRPDWNSVISKDLDFFQKHLIN